MKELRVQHDGNPYRILFAFDPQRQAVLLIGGNKRENITLGTLISTIAAMGGSIDLTVNFPEQPSVQFSQIETSFLSNRKE